MKTHLVNFPASAQNRCHSVYKALEFRYGSLGWDLTYRLSYFVKQLQRTLVTFYFQSAGVGHSSAGIADDAGVISGVFQAKFFNVEHGKFRRAHDFDVAFLAQRQAVLQPNKLERLVPGYRRARNTASFAHRASLWERKWLDFGWNCN